MLSTGRHTAIPRASRCCSREAWFPSCTTSGFASGGESRAELRWNVVPIPGGSVMKRVSFALLTLAAVAPLQAQSLLYRPPNLGGTWVPDGGVVQFNFVHRFYVTPGPSHSVINFPNFTLAAGFGHQAAFGAHFATRSIVGLGSGALSTNEAAVHGRSAVHGVSGSLELKWAFRPIVSHLAV